MVQNSQNNLKEGNNKKLGENQQSFIKIEKICKFTEEKSKNFKLNVQIIT